MTENNTNTVDFSDDALSRLTEQVQQLIAAQRIKLTKTQQQKRKT